MDLFEILHTCYGHNEVVNLFMELELILTKLRPFELSHFRHFSCKVVYGDCAISFSYDFQRIVLKPCIHVVDIMKMYMWAFDEAIIDFDRITGF